jgi:hypothetical protein
MDFGPLEEHPQSPFGHISSHSAGQDFNHGFLAAILCVEMWGIMIIIVYEYNDSIKPGNLRHFCTLTLAGDHQDSLAMRGSQEQQNRHRDLFGAPDTIRTYGLNIRSAFLPA